MPYDVAFSLPDDEALGHYVALGEIDGGTFDWNAMQWERPAAPVPPRRR